MPPAAVDPALPPGETILALLATEAVATHAARAIFRPRDRRTKRACLYDPTTGS
jgi:hypothetical protein